ncbi:hypothetical protein [Nonomuraea soli]|uniref:Sortase n=1 Tax=Nonomuraea soli TaxID=1032476 RepID=A0A7W0HUT8_9ACTN|nr:hypothetical protein [Nonomuraea soli]MBA2896544.1 hypothetical protein [Nonomuraea soli]
MVFLRRAVLAAAVLVVGMAGPAVAEVDISPYKAEPGDSVRITTDDGGDCGDADLVGESDAFDEEVVLEQRGDLAVGVADVAWDADPGRYDVVVECDRATFVDDGSFIVVGGWGPDTGGGGLALSAETAAKGEAVVKGEGADNNHTADKGANPGNSQAGGNSEVAGKSDVAAAQPGTDGVQLVMACAVMVMIAASVVGVSVLAGRRRARMRG